MSSTTLPSDRTAGLAPSRPSRRHLLTGWRPEDPDFWAAGGRRTARRNLAGSILSEHVGFSVWVIWSVASAYLLGQGFDFTAKQLFLLVALPNLVGSLLRVPYTFAVPRFGGRRWTMASAALLLVPTLGFAYAVTRPGTPYWLFCLIAATAGLGGGNFASSMANINFFYPAAEKGRALGLNAAGGNLGVALIQLLLPVVVGGAGLFGLVHASAGGIHLERAAWLYAGLAVVAVGVAFVFMDDIEGIESHPREQLAVLRHRHVQVLSLLYVGTFGSFIGYSSAMPLLIKLNFWRQPLPSVAGIGINFAFYAFLGALVGSVVRPVGGWLADRYGGARVSLVCFLGMTASTLGILVSLSRLEALPPAPSADALARIAADPGAWHYPDAVVSAVDTNSGVFPLFLGLFVCLFAFSGAGNGSLYRIIPHVFRNEALADTEDGSPERELALVDGAKRASAAAGLIGAVGALGGFLIPITFNSPWVSDPLAATRSAFWIFTAFYVLCAVVTWAVYVRRGATHAGL